MKYKDYKLKDFLADEEFRNWVLKPNEHSNEFWLGWMDVCPEQRVTILKANEIIHAMVSQEAEIMDSAEMHEILKNILKTKAGRQISPYRKITAIAASIALFLFIGYLGFDQLISKDTVPGQESLQKIIKSNPRGVKSIIRLKDGTKVHLNANSSITYFENYTESRFIELDGEAFFEVATDPLNPLIVKSGRIQTKAIGTSFNVIKDQDRSEVLLIEGIVEVSNIQDERNNRKQLQPMQKITFDEEFGLSEVVTVQDKTEILWTQGVLHFEGLQISEVFQQLENWYDVDIEVTGKMNDIRYTGEFDNEYLDNIISAMSIALDFEYDLNRKKVRIEFKL